MIYLRNKENLKTLWPLFMDGVQLSQGYIATIRRQFNFFPLYPHEFPVLIWLSSEGWKAESTLKQPSGFELSAPGLRIQCTKN